ncbi:toxin-antitoxin system HicB family antitoxin [Novosphingobium sp. Gsoil 351]|uniref:toxin-antitoxin system HicB family antitoxin n=1 Tax=Novosphingobium sp. Gsoil 351 TaxID=2675225 RepID=UPI0012B4F78F|nr:toxin-antitoxin system HicB family antitoxin [Novosphingobium sp. Gsoil 351]QGN54543.1 toxin-antitoxin system HicB family antitoxin [Novosphingobium sp. Gsoil 351]
MAGSGPSGTGKKAFPLRLDPALHAAVERAAASDLRSVNAQIECLLREALTRRGVRLQASPQPKRGRPPKDPVKPAS